MDILSLLAKTLDPPWNYFLIMIGLVAVLVPKFLDIRRELINSSDERSELILKKEKLELLKLQFEIEALRRQYDLPVSESVSILLKPDVAEAPAPKLPPAEGKVSVPEVSVPEVSAEEKVKAAIPVTTGISSFLLALAQGVLAFFGVIFAIEIFFVPYLTITEGDSYAVALLGSLFSMFVTWAIYKGYMRLRRLRKRL